MTDKTRPPLESLFNDTIAWLDLALEELEKARKLPGQREALMGQVLPGDARVLIRDARRLLEALLREGALDGLETMLAEENPGRWQKILHEWRARNAQLAEAERTETRKANSREQKGKQRDAQNEEFLKDLLAAHEKDE